MRAGHQTTLLRSETLVGVGVHSGAQITVALHPSPADTGFVFTRTTRGKPDRCVRAEPRTVVSTECAIVLGDDAGPIVSTVEHLLAALRSLGIDNASIEVDGPEIPILDGSAAPIVTALDAAGIATLSAPRRYLKVLRPVGVVNGDAYGEIRPNDSGFRVEIEIDFDHVIVGRQVIALDVTPAAFRRQLARARTFGFLQDFQRLLDAGYARGAGLENTLVVGEDRVLNAEGLRFANEFVRHKALDAVGDLALAGLPILGTYASRRGGHRLNHAVLSALLADRSAWTIEERAPTQRPVSVPRGHGYGERAGVAQPVLAPDLT